MNDPAAPSRPALPVELLADDEAAVYEPAAPRRRRVALPAALFVATLASTFFAGLLRWSPESLAEVAAPGELFPLRRLLLREGATGLIYMASVVAILLSHEMGHFLTALRLRVGASLPFFLPMPLAPFGTMGAVIALEGHRANRRQIFDIGIAGPLAGLVPAVPIVLYGAWTLDFTVAAGGGLAVDLPLALRWLVAALQPAGYTGQTEVWLSQMNPWFMAGWFGLLITGLNMAPVSQLDGGHVVYTLLGRRGVWLSRAFILAAMVYIAFAQAYIWAVMALLVVLLGVDHPPTADDRAPLGPARTWLGWASLSIPFLCLPPHALTILQPLG